MSQILNSGFLPHGHNIFTRANMQGSVVPFEAKRGLRAKRFGKHCYRW